MANEVKLKLAIEGGAVVGSTLDATGTSLKRMGESSRVAQASLSELTGQLAVFSGALAGVASVQKAIAAASDFNALTARIQLLVGSADKAAVSMQTVYEIAQRQGASLMAVGDSYAKIGQAMTSLGGTSKDTAKMVETVAGALRLGNASTQEAASAMRQFGQAMAKGKLNGDEFVSLMENAPYLMDAVAASLGKTKGELFGMAEAGQLTSEVISNAVLGSFDSVTQKAATLPQTIGQAMENVTTTFTKAAAESKMVGLASASAMGAMGIAAEHAGFILDTLAKGALLLVVRQSLIAADAFARQTLATMAASAANVAKLTTTAAAADAQAVYTAAVLRDAIVQQASAITYVEGMAAHAALTAARAANTAATVAQTAAQLALNTATSIGTKALGLLGGPIGIVTAVLGIGLTAWSMWGGSAKDAEDKAAGAVEKSTTQIVADINNQIERLERRNALAGKAMPGVNGLDMNSPAAERLGALQIKLNSLAKETAGTAREQALIYEKRNKLLAEQGQIQQALLELEGKAAPERAIANTKAHTDAMAKYAPEVDKVTKALNEERKALGASFTPEDEAKIRKFFAAQKAGTKDSANGYADLQDAAKVWADTLKDADKITADTQASTDGLNTAQKRLLEYLTSTAYQINSEDMRQVALAHLYAAVSAEQNADSQKEYQRIVAETAKQLETYEQGQQKLVGTSFQEVEAAQSAYDAHNKLKSVIAEEELARLELNRTLTAMAGDDTSVINQQIANKKRLIAILKDGEVRDASEQSAKDAADAWNKTTEQIGQSLTDQLMEGGRSAADYLKNLFRTLVLRPVISAVSNPVAQGVTAMLGTAGTANAATGIGTGTGIMGTMALAASTFGEFAAGAFMGTVTGTASAGAFIAGGAQLASTGSVAAGSGAMVGAAMPYVLAAIAIYKTLNGDWFSGEKRSGGQYASNGQSGTAFVGGPSGGEVNAIATRKAIDLTQGTINTLLKDLGSVATLTGFKAGFELSDQGSGGVAAGGRLSNGNSFGDAMAGSVYGGTLFDKSKGFDLSPQEAGAKFGTELGQSIIESLQATDDIPNTIKQLITESLDGVQVSALSAEQTNTLVANIDKVRTTVNGFRAATETLPFEALKNLSFDAAAGLIAAAGGMDKLGTSLGTYYDNFFSAEEKRANTVSNIGKALSASGADIPAALRDLSVGAIDTQTEIEGVRTAFRDLVDGSMKDITPAGQATTAALLAVSGTLGTLLPVAAETAAKAIKSVAEILTDASDKLKTDATDLQVQLLRAQGDNRGADFLAMGVDPTAAGSESVVKQYNANASTRAWIKTLEDVKTVTDDLNSTGRGLQDQYNKLNMSEADYRLTQIAGMTALQVAQFDTNAALQSSIDLRTKENEAINTAAQAIAARVGDGASLQNQWNKLYMTDAQYRETQIAGMTELQVAQYDTNVGIQTSINLRNAETEAIKTSAETLKSAIANARSSQTSLASKYANPLTDQSASAMLPGGIADLLRGQSSTGIRDLIGNYAKSLNPNTPTGLAAIAQLDRLTPALDYFVGAADTATASATALAKAAQDASDALDKQLSSDSANLNVELLAAQGKGEASLAAARVIATAGMNDAQRATWDYNTATRGVIASLKDYADIGKSLASAKLEGALSGLSDFAKFFAHGDMASGLVTTLDGSLKSLQTLDTTSVSMYQEQLALVQQIRNAATSVHDSFAQAIRGIQLDLLATPDKKYDFFDKEAQKYRDILATLTDPTAIALYSSKLSGSIMDGYGTLEPTQKTATGEKFISLLDGADALSQSRFTAAQSAVQNNYDTLAKKIEAAITKGIADGLKKAADDMAAAAVKMQTAADTPVKVDVHVTTDVAATSELTHV